jgi:hypothetical protein
MAVQVRGRALIWVPFSLEIIKGEYNMTIINLDTFRKQKEKQMVTIPIIERIYKEDGEVKIEVSGEQEVSKAWLNRHDKQV